MKAVMTMVIIEIIVVISDDDDEAFDGEDGFIMLVLAMYFNTLDLDDSDVL